MCLLLPYPALPSRPEIPERTVIRSSTRHAPGLGSGSSAERLRDNGAAAREPRKRRRSSQRKASR